MRKEDFKIPRGWVIQGEYDIFEDARTAEKEYDYARLYKVEDKYVVLIRKDEVKESLEEATVRVLIESVDWDYYDKFEEIIDKYMPDSGEGDTFATQIATAVNKLVYKWYNDGDVYDNVNSGMIGWANDLSSYANWLNKYCDKAKGILDVIYQCSSEDKYEGILKSLADACLDDDYLAAKNKEPKQGSIYDCEGPFEFTNYDEE